MTWSGFFFWNITLAAMWMKEWKQQIRAEDWFWGSCRSSEERQWSFGWGDCSGDGEGRLLPKLSFAPPSRHSQPSSITSESYPLWLYMMTCYNYLLACLFLHWKVTSLKSINAYFMLRSVSQLPAWYMEVSQMFVEGEIYIPYTLHSFF